MNHPGKDGIYENDKKEHIYANADPVNSHDFKIETENTRRPPQHTGSDCVKIRNYRAAVVCLVLLCVLLLTAVIVLCVHIHTNYTEDRDEQLINITNLTQERDELLTRNTDLTKERDQLLTRNTDLTKERDQLLTRNTDLTKERVQQLNRNADLTKERDQLLTRNTDLTKERDSLSSSNQELIKQRDQSNQEKNKLLNSLHGWAYYQSNFYYISSQKKSWYESRRYCTGKGADLIIINNREEQDFAKKLSCGSNVWIGLTDREVEGTWKWVDGSTPRSRFWVSGEPNSHAGDEDCAITMMSGHKQRTQTPRDTKHLDTQEV
ncbi:hypothetical protein Q8A67_023724 [Cirrhinus molitorella]|uniref:C-type lectin domain-containing protein n=1 Tax=Cirrhinus molitorella TaxID=172907 RepID=A0AA88PEE6_9TELE|nr:hypothetical protein Q8A67_023724 [Cirrhinus molitorella]